MQETMMYWPDIFQHLSHPFGVWQLMDAVFHTLLISWLKYVLLKFYTILDSTSIQIFISFFFRQPKKKVKDSEAANGMLKSDV
jgi:hypothetical protein